MPRFYAVTATVGSSDRCTPPTITDFTETNERPISSIFFIHDRNGERCVRRIWFESYAEAKKFLQERK